MFATAYSQDHYWSQQYGGRATLMGGTAIAGTNDNSSIYYNPGGLGFIDSARTTTSSYVLGFEYMRLKNGAGTGLDLKSVRINILPQLITGSIPIKKVPKLKLIYGTLLRARTNLRVAQENENVYDVIRASSGDEYYRAHVEYTYSSLEQWAGFGLAYKINESWSVGVSSFGTFTHMEVRNEQTTSADAIFNGLSYTTSVRESNAMNLNQFMQIFKLGAAARFKHVQLGMALTLPGIKIWGEGRLEKSFEVHNLNLNASDTNMPAQRYDSYIVSDVQRHLSSHYRTPLSASFGFKLVYPAFTLSAAIEYFMGYKNQVVLKGADHAVIRPAIAYGNDTVRGFMSVQTSAAHVLNGGLGAEVKITTGINLLLGVRTDFSNRTEYLPNNSVIGVATSRSPNWDYLYFSSGFSYKLASHNLTAGFDYGVGIATRKTQLFNITEPTQDVFLRGNLNNDMRASVHKLNFILSYTYFFKARERKYGPFSIIEDLNKANKKKKALRNKM